MELQDATGGTKFYRQNAPYTLGLFVCLVIPCLCFVGWWQFDLPGTFTLLFSFFACIAALYCCWILFQRRPVIHLDTLAHVIRLESVSLPFWRREIPFSSIEGIVLEFEPDTTHRILILTYNKLEDHGGGQLRFLLGNVDADPIRLLKTIRATTEGEQRRSKAQSIGE